MCSVSCHWLECSIYSATWPHRTFFYVKSMKQCHKFRKVRYFYVAIPFFLRIQLMFKWAIWGPTACSKMHIRTHRLCLTLTLPKPKLIVIICWQACCETQTNMKQAANKHTAVILLKIYDQVSNKTTQRDQDNMRHQRLKHHNAVVH